MYCTLLRRTPPVIFELLWKSFWHRADKNPLRKNHATNEASYYCGNFTDTYFFKLWCKEDQKANISAPHAERKREVKPHLVFCSPLNIAENWLWWVYHSHENCIEQVFFFNVQYLFQNVEIVLFKSVSKQIIFLNNVSVEMFKFLKFFFRTFVGKFLHWR